VVGIETGNGVGVVVCILRTFKSRIIFLADSWNKKKKKCVSKTVVS
jgi:hypothetical protein